MQQSTISDIRALFDTSLDEIRAVGQIPTAHTATLSTIDWEIGASSCFNGSLPLHRNAVAPISTLPPELLVRIFHFHALLEPPRSGLQQSGSIGWIRVTHVCQRWRQVALYDSLLWATITVFLSSVEWFSETLARARNAPLIVDLEGTPNPKIFPKFLPHITRTRELRLRNLSPFEFRGVQEIFALEAPALEHFELGLNTVASIIDFRFAARTLFKGRTPKLRTLSLSQVAIPWSFIPRGQLTELKITHFRGIFNCSTSWPGSFWDDDPNQLIDLLISSPELEVLVLEFCFPPGLSQVSLGQPIHLPRLSHLHLGGSTTHVANLYTMLQLPSSATLHLRCISEGSSTDSDHLILSLVSAHFHDLTPSGFKSFRVTINYMENLVDVTASIATPRSTIHHSHGLGGDVNSEPELALSFGGVSEYGHSTYGDVLGRLCSMLPISNLEVLSICASEATQSVDWYKLFQCCTNVTTIQARGRGTTSLMQALSPLEPTKIPGSKEKYGKRDDGATQPQAVTDSAGSHVTGSPFPKLASLLLEDLNFNTVVPYSGTLYDVILNAVRQYKVNKTPLQTLSLGRCIIITADRAKSLKKFVQDFHWDGGEGLIDPWKAVAIPQTPSLGHR